MWYIKIKRLLWAIQYGWTHTSQISKENYGGRKHFVLFFDFLICFLNCGINSSQYKQQKMWKLEKSQRKQLMEQFRAANQKKNAWAKDFYDNRKFLNKYMSFRYEKSWLKEKRNRAYAKRYNAGADLHVEHDVNISRQHYLDGTITMGDNVLLAKHVFIDYSGEVIIEDKVKIANGVCIESHHRDLEAYKQGKDINIPTKLKICEGAYIGTRAIILDSCNYIGKYSRIGAGAVVTKDVPDYAVVVGVPAKVVKMLNQE